MAEELQELVREDLQQYKVLQERKLYLFIEQKECLLMYLNLSILVFFAF